MRRLIYIIMGVSFVVLHGYADLKQEILSLTNGVRLKAVWVRSNASQSLDNLYNRGGSSILMGFDTQEGVVRVIDSIRGNHSYPLISRRGEYVVWNQDPNNNVWGGSSPNTVSYVVKWDRTGRTKLLDGAAGDPSYVLCFMLDDRTNEEWVYTCRLANHGSSNPNPTIYRYPFSKGAVDKNRRETVYTATGNPIPIVISGRGKYIGGNFPWAQCAPCCCSNR